MKERNRLEKWDKYKKRERQKHISGQTYLFTFNEERKKNAIILFGFSIVVALNLRK